VLMSQLRSECFELPQLHGQMRRCGVGGCLRCMDHMLVRSWRVLLPIDARC
jgi:hypothetical protein